ncbi:putative dna damage repair protein [Phaeomoniella chlamydospora]|uniref:DNA repair protein REV1 n=1 Tax=Phaeomoniella chlamydospora TaxID=158046 RepID=A0A0G2EEP9_PHACM|nr:putative dna damage repair protein [Phaeomoniella chlamydospora]
MCVKARPLLPCLRPGSTLSRYYTFDDEHGEEYEASTFGGFTDYMRRKKIKLQNLDAEIRKKSQGNIPIFRDVVACVNGYTQPSLNDLHALIVGHGGGFLQYLDGKTTATHIIASNLTPKKREEFKRYRIVSPQWVVDSVRAGKLQPWDQYRVVDEGVNQKVLGFENGQMTSQANTQSRGYREQTEGSWYTSQLKDQGSGAQSHPAVSVSKEEEDLLNDSFDDRIFEEVNGGGVDDLAFHKEVHGDNPTKNNDVATGDKLSPRPLLPNKEHVIAQTEARLPKTSDEFQLSSSKTPQSPKKGLTAEEHNAILLSDPRMRKSSTVNPEFLKQYYQESRLHHLSTWKAELKAQLQALTQEKVGARKSQQKRAPGARRYIMHVDFDSFFAAVSLRKHPEHVGKPVVVAHGSGSGSEIASCNYPARTFGVKNGMWMKTALQLCPDLKVLPYEYEAYEDTSRLFYECIMDTEGIVQSVSIDEALVDITAQVLPTGGSDGKGVSEGSIFREQTQADDIARKLRNRVKEATGCDVSVGIGGNILLARVALRKAKPAGQHQIKPEEILNFLGGLTVQDLPGVAYSIGSKLEELGVKYVKDIRGLTRERLITTLGPKTGEKIWDYSRGIDRVEVGEQVIRKSVSAEVNWGIRFVNQAQADEFVYSLCEELSRRLLENSVKGKQLTMKIMKRSADAPLDPPKHLGHGKCDTFNKSILLGVATNAKEVIGREAVSMLKSYNFSPGELRGLGVQMTKLEPLKPLSTAAPENSQRRLQFKQPEATPKKVKDSADPIEDFISPEKPQAPIPPVFGGLPKAEPDHKPLNVTGTQFVLPSPSQIDPSVLAELPADIRSKLAPPPKNFFEPKPVSRDVSPTPLAMKETKSRSQSPFANLPSQSQIDPETLAALPEDVQAEVRAYYAQETKHRPAQQLLPQSPRKNRPPATLPKKLHTTPTKKKGSSLLNRGRPAKSLASSSSASTLTQSAFVPVRHSPSASISTSARDGAKTPPPNTNSATESFLSDISPSFLDALPPDIRSELLAQQRQERMKTKSGLSVSLASKPRATKTGVNGANSDKDGVFAGIQRTIKLPPRPEKPSFTRRKLTKMEDLREAIKGWVEMFKDVESDDSDAEEEIGTADEQEFDQDIGVGNELVQHARRRSQMGIGDGFDVTPTKQRPQRRINEPDSSSPTPLPNTMPSQHINLHGNSPITPVMTEDAEEADDPSDEQPPYKEDVQALSIYLTRVIKEEQDVSKATDLVKWLDWCVNDMVIDTFNHNSPANQENRQPDPQRSEIKRPKLISRWIHVVQQLKTNVQRAANETGVRGVLDFG